MPLVSYMYGPLHDFECAASYRSANAIASLMALPSATGLKVMVCFSSFESSDQISNTTPAPIDGRMTYFGMAPKLRYEQRHPGAISHKYQNGLLMMTLTCSAISNARPATRMR